MDLTNLPTPAPPPGALPIEAEESDEETEITDSNNVESWEHLPAGDYLEPDESGTNWFRANNGDNWYQNADESWTKWQD